MRYWWVNQKQTHRHEIGGGYDQLVRSPKPLAALKREQEKLDLGSAARRVRTQWLDRDSASRVISELFGARAASRALGAEKLATR